MSTGEIKRFFGMVGPSDIRKVQELMLPQDDVDYRSNLRVFGYRFPADCVREKACSVGRLQMARRQTWRERILQVSKFPLRCGHLLGVLGWLEWH